MSKKSPKTKPPVGSRHPAPRHRPEWILHPTLALFVISLSVSAVLGWGWIGQHPSPEELYGDTGRYIEGFRQKFLSGEIEWWTGDFLSGHPSAYHLMFAFPSLIGAAAVSLFGSLSGLKIVLLLCMPLFSTGVYLVTGQLTKDRWTAFAAGVLSLSSPQLLLRVADFEHYNSVFCMTLAPFLLWSVTKASETGKIRDALVLGALASAMVLSYAKLSIMFAPSVLLFAGWLYFSRPAYRKSIICSSAIAILTTALCALPMLLPMVREYQWAALFSAENLRGWQISFSIKSLVSVLDRENLLLDGMPAFFLTDRGQFYVGLLGVASVLLLAKFAPPRWLVSQLGAVFRIFAAISLVSLWLSHGSNSPATGLRMFLSNAQMAKDWIIPLVWAMAVLPAIFIHFLLPPSKYRPALTLVLSLVYYLVPGFSVLSSAPLFSDIRAPWGFWEMSFFSVPIMVAIAARVMTSGLSHREFLFVVIVLIFPTSVFDSSGYFMKFFRGGLSPQFFEEFAQVNEKLRSSKVPGRVHPISGRYFYLRIPVESGRGLSDEALWSHFKMKPYADFLRGALASKSAFASYLNVGGISHLLIDKEGGEISSSFIASLPESLEVIHDGEHFLLLENRGALYPAFLAENYISLSGNSEKIAQTLLESSPALHAVPVETENAKISSPFLCGRQAPSGDIAVMMDSMSSFSYTRVPHVSPRQNSSRIRLEVPPSPTPRWLVIPEAWHPDWVAYSENGKLEIRKAFGALMTLVVPSGSTVVTLTYVAPVWYNASVLASIIAWVVLLASIGWLTLRAKINLPCPAVLPSRRPSS